MERLDASTLGHDQSSASVLVVPLEVVAAIGEVEFLHKTAESGATAVTISG